MLLVIFPLAIVLSTIGVSVNTFPVGFIVFPLTFVYVTVCMVKYSIAIGFVVAPTSFVARTIRPFLLASAVSLSAEPLSSVNCSTGQSDRTWDGSIPVSRTIFVIQLCVVIVIIETAWHEIILSMQIMLLFIVSLVLNCFPHLVLVYFSYCLRVITLTRWK